MMEFNIETNGQLQPHLTQEWLLTNGLGGFSSSSVLGCNTRRYHGLLCAAATPPVGRVLALSRLAEIISFENEHDKPFELGVNQFREAFHPHGWHHLRSFELGDIAAWRYEVESLRIDKQVQLLWRKNVVGVRYIIQPAKKRKVRFAVAPFTSLRDFHGLRKAANSHFEVNSDGADVSINADGHTLLISCEGATFQSQPDWWYDHYYNIENDRGMDDTEDLFTPGRFQVDTAGEQKIVTLWASLGERGPFKWDDELQYRRKTIAATRTAPASPVAKDLPTLATDNSSIIVKRLARAANDFVVFRRMPSGQEGSTVIAGYPWFADWGRDTMISLPGLFLVTGRFEQARQVLGVFAQYCSEGMIPNLFDDYSNQPQYNTVDASLWFIHAAFEYLRYTGDRATFNATLKPACQSIIDGYRRGTRYHIKMDPTDGLISQGDANTQLTWMDAKCGGVAFTPRQGKAVEINALWYHALRLMGINDLADQVAVSFKKAFWISPFRGLADVVDGPATVDGYPNRDMSLRPNQIFAVSLAHSALTADQQRAVVEVVRRELLTPMGLRSLNKADSRYAPRYNGNQYRRDSFYHNGTVWAWLIGGFLQAYVRVNDRSPTAIEHARGWLRPLIDQMNTNCIGQIAEIYEAEEPHRMVGCPAQAWSVAETLRLAVDLGM